ncbi:MAG: hypothetical protein AAF585_22330, partial [Verrucomicrobiota bacterium]
EIRETPIKLVIPEEEQTQIVSQLSPTAKFTIPKLRKKQPIAIPELPWTSNRTIRWWVLIPALMVCVFAIWLGKSKKLKLLTLFSLVALSAGALFAFKTGDPIPDQANLDQDRLREITHAILHNIYISFEHRIEEEIYDNLAQSVEGPLLENVYLEISRSLQLEEEGGPRVQIASVDVRDAELTSWPEDHTFEADVTWAAIGTVAHWGHEHTRIAQYHARLIFTAIDSKKTKLVSIEISEKVW